MCNTLIRPAIMTLVATAAFGCQAGGRLGKTINDDNVVTIATPAADKDVLPDAPADGEYVLIVPGPTAVPLFSALLKKGDKVGFMHMTDGTTKALAGDRTFDVTGRPGVAWVQGKTK